MKFDVGTQPDGTTVLRFQQGSMQMMVALQPEDLQTMVRMLMEHQHA